ncbi:DHS-like NAD/FAD-binding domain-containing protein [Mollisia scopiformis]|uniref:DHS-like NAD/FAD-binding domain-containing protein n=1 Tax=Mollisia scopiformis TaxID=149040 RepID=A0A194XSN7_MOLSC|nr:DHS-like NAD/FAD-binding domain-containing protein [Mollisia scopiformis]KUJ23156.1 DHS-like NAD/FAD-binding domain-containing protein [Mollisia scopiformis]
MATSGPTPPKSSYGPSTDIQEFHDVLKSSKRIMALCGAGLSAASGLGTFRGAGGMWRNHKATALATPEAFERDPGLVWLFYSYRRHMALQAKPNAGHYALVEASKRMRSFLTMSQNVDGLSQRAKHPRDQLKLLHGSLFDIKCFSCDYIELNNFDDPFHPLLAIDSDEDARLAAAANNGESTKVKTKPILPKNLPHCPSCKTGLLRPGVVWFGEPLPEDTVAEIDSFIDEDKVDLMLVIGTTATVYPAAGYVDEARKKGARVAVVNMDGLDGELGAASNLKRGDFLFQGDAAKILPEILKPLIGELKIPETEGV